MDDTFSLDSVVWGPEHFEFEEEKDSEWLEQEKYKISLERQHKILTHKKNRDVIREENVKQMTNMKDTIQMFKTKLTKMKIDRDHDLRQRAAFVSLTMVDEMSQDKDLHEGRMIQLEQLNAILESFDNYQEFVRQKQREYHEKKQKNRFKQRKHDEETMVQLREIYTEYERFEENAKNIEVFMHKPCQEQVTYRTVIHGQEHKHTFPACVTAADIYTYITYTHRISRPLHISYRTPTGKSVRMGKKTIPPNNSRLRIEISE